MGWGNHANPAIFSIPSDQLQLRSQCHCEHHNIFNGCIRCALQELQVVFPLDQLPITAQEFSLPCYLTQSCWKEKRWIHTPLWGCLCESKCIKLDQNSNSLPISHFELLTIIPPEYLNTFQLNINHSFILNFTELSFIY